MVFVFELSHLLWFPLHYDDLQHLESGKADRDNIEGSIHDQLVCLSALVVGHEAIGHGVVEPLVLIAALLNARVEGQHRCDDSESLVYKVCPVPHAFEDAVDRFDGVVVQTLIVVDVLGVVVEALSDALHEGFVASYLSCQFFVLFSVFLVMSNIGPLCRSRQCHSDKERNSYGKKLVHCFVKIIFLINKNRNNDHCAQANVAHRERRLRVGRQCPHQPVEGIL